MASSGSLPCEEQLLCPICLQVFTDPVSTPCGHNYCKACITTYWTSSNVAHCPICNQKFRKRPKLVVNTGFRDMVEHFKNMTVSGEHDSLSKPGEVSCDVCPGPKLKAQKTCLVCLASYCQLHLEAHHRVSTLKKHQLVDPVSNLEDKVCKQHDKMVELFCRVDQTCVCLMCLKDDHMMHETIPLDHALSEKKTQLEEVMSEIKMMENNKSRRIKKIKSSMEQSRKESEKDIADIAKVFNALVVSLKRSQTTLTQMIQEKQRAVEKQAGDLLTQLEKEISELKSRRLDMEQLLQTEDLSLLKRCPPLHVPSQAENPCDPLPHVNPFEPGSSDTRQQSYVGTVKKAVDQMKKTLTREMDMLTHEVTLSGGAAEQPHAAERPMRDEFINELWTPPRDRLMMIQQCDAVDVTLDAYTANPSLEVLEDGKRLTLDGNPQSFSSYFGRRFQHLPLVLGKEGFCSGRFYFEVQVSGSSGWVLGVVKESINREIKDFPTPADGGWAILKYGFPFTDTYVNTFGEPAIYLEKAPQTIGVFVDYEMGEVSFYDVDTRTVIMSSTGCSFIESSSALKAFLYSVAGSSVNDRPKLYPFMGVFAGGETGLVITPVACSASGARNISGRK